VISAFRRQRGDDTRVLPEPGVSCSIPGCGRHDAQPCAYCDRRGRSCSVASCPAHTVIVAAVAYCRRHAGTVNALAATEPDSGGMPDLHDRAPSLVNWIASDMDGTIRALLIDATRPRERVLSDGCVQLTRDMLRRGRWERSWRIIDDTGLVLKVSIHIDDGDDSLVHVRVGDVTVGEGIPPWITNRRNGDAVAASIDVAQRQHFYSSLEEAIAGALRDPGQFTRD